MFGNIRMISINSINVAWPLSVRFVIQSRWSMQNLLLAYKRILKTHSTFMSSWTKVIVYLGGKC